MDYLLNCFFPVVLKLSVLIGFPCRCYQAAVQVSLVLLSHDPAAHLTAGVSKTQESSRQHVQAIFAVQGPLRDVEWGGKRSTSAVRAGAVAFGRRGLALRFVRAPTAACSPALSVQPSPPALRAASVPRSCRERFPGEHPWDQGGGRSTQLLASQTPLSSFPGRLNLDLIFLI